MTSEELLKKGFTALAIPVSGEQFLAFLTYLSELKKWNRTYNLTALRTDRDIIVKHFLDSLLYMKILPEGTLKLADAGSGAGFPGIPLKIMRPEIEITLIESSRKKTAFLRHIIRLLQLGKTDVLEERIEKLGQAYEKKFDVALSRATFGIKEFLDVACPYVKEGGKLLLSKGPGLSEELKELKTSEYAHVELEVLKYNLPVENAVRNLISITCPLEPLE